MQKKNYKSMVTIGALIVLICEFQQLVTQFEIVYTLQDIAIDPLRSSPQMLYWSDYC